MISSTTRRRRTSAVGAAAIAAAVAAGVLSPVGGSSPAAAAPLPAPPVVGPADSGPVLKEVVLDWAPVAGAASYVVQVGADEEWSDDPTLTLKTVATRLTLPTSLPHASYVWRVAAVGSDGQGRWSSAGTFTRGWRAQPQPLSPLGAVDPLAGFPTFRWTPVPTASEYELQVSDSPTFDAPFRTQADHRTTSCFTTRTSVTPFNGQADEKGKNDGAGDCIFSLLGTGAPLWWRVRALDHVVDDAPELDTTPVVDEGISSQPPAPMGELDTSACPSEPVPMTSSRPVGGSAPSPTASASPAASASPVASASPAASASASPSAAPAADEQDGSCEPAHTVEKGAWSAGAAFTHAMAWPYPAPNYRSLAAPATPTASSDVCTAALLCRDFPTVSWTRVPGAQWYRLYVALDADFTNIHDIVETAAQTWTPTEAWRDSTAGAAYHVAVQACTVDRALDGSAPGCAAPSTPLVFRKSSPKLATATPAQGAAVGGGEVVLSWQASSAALSAATGAPATSEAYAYRVQVTTADDPDFSAELVDEATVDSTHHVAAELRYPDGAYLWRVQPVDASGHRLPWSVVRSFRRDGTAPTASVPSAGRFPSTSTLQVRFSEPVTGLAARSVTLTGAAATAVPAADRRSATLRLTRPLLPGASHVLTLSPDIRDAAGNAVAARPVTVKVDPDVDDRSGALVLGGAWKRLAASNAVAGTWSRSAPTVARPTTATVALRGRAAVVKGCVGPANGLVEVRVDGVRVSRVDTYRSYSACGVVLARTSFRTAGTHSVQLRGIGAKSARSKGTVVAVDAVTAVP